MTRKKRAVNPNEYLFFNRKIYIAAGITAIMILSGLTGITVYWKSQPMISTGYYHFNIQYRAGNVTTYDQIITNTFQHIIWMYGNHTTWNYTVECQFLLLQQVYNDFPTLFKEIQEQNQRGQLELIVPQYSDSFQVPYPLKDFKESVNYTATRMAELNLTESKLILLQEGQWLPAFGQLGNTGNFEGAIISKEQCAYFDYYPTEPVLQWNFGGQSKYAFVIPWVSTFQAGVYHNQVYTQDGEKINTGGKGSFNVALDFSFNPLKQQNLESRLMDLQKKGDKFMTMQDFFNYCLKNNYVEKMNKFVPETEWVAAKYHAFFTWMGDGSGASDDGYMLARYYYAQNIAQATEQLVDSAYNKGVINTTEYAYLGNYRINGKDGLLLDANKKIWNATVTDTTGISPEYCEFWYGMNNTKEAIDICDYITAYIQSKDPGSNSNPYNGTIQINPATRKIYNNTADFLNNILIQNSNLNNVENLFGLNVSVQQDNQYQNLYPYTQSVEKRELIGQGWNQTFYELKFGFDGLYNITLQHNESNYIPENELSNYQTPNMTQRNDISVTFDDNWSKICYSPALFENNTVNLTRSDYFYKPYNSKLEWWVLLSLCNGMLYNPEKGYGIVTVNQVRHLAANWKSDSVTFAETGVKYNSVHEYYLVRGSLSQVLAFANQINSYAAVTANGNGMSLGGI